MQFYGQEYEDDWRLENYIDNGTDRQIDRLRIFTKDLYVL